LDEILESQSKTLSLAIRLIDDFTSAQPIGAINVSLKDVKSEPVKNPSGYFLFFKLKGDLFSVQVQSDFYQLANVDVHLSLLDPKEPVQNIVLIPNLAYPFPSGTTLIRGMVVEPPADVAASGATVEIPERILEAQTSTKGEYLFYLKPLKQEEIVTEQDPSTKENVRYLKTAAGKSIQINASHGGYFGSLTVDRVSEGISNNVKYIKLK
jgi:hypothetical protein